MPLNKSTGNMYGFVTHTWNSVKGACPHRCSYCYMKKCGKQPPLHFDDKELKADLGSGNYIFIGSSCDMFAKDIPGEWIARTLAKANLHDNKYLIQSKNPARFLDYINLPSEKYMFCTTIETNNYFVCMGETPTPYERAQAISRLNYHGYKTMITIEPILKFKIDEFVKIIEMCQPEQVNLGADSGGNHLPEPSSDEIAAFIEALRPFTKVYLKPNLKRLYKEKV